LRTNCMKRRSGRRGQGYISSSRSPCLHLSGADPTTLLALHLDLQFADSFIP
jgi:hypothetical protein